MIPLESQGSDSGMSRAPERSSPSLVRVVLALGLAGLATSIVITATTPFRTGHGLFPIGSFTVWMTLALAVGLVFRVLRRKTFWGADMSLHQAFSFEVLFQGAILFCPQLPFPAVEREFMMREMTYSTQQVAPWFRVRRVSALMIPLVLAGIVMFLLGELILAGVLIGLSFAGLVIGARNAARERTSWFRFSVATTLGLIAAIAEGGCFMAAGRILQPDSPSWQICLLYLLILTGYELSPIPFALGIPEALYAATIALPDLLLPGLVLPVAYRFWRAFPVVLGTLFYLPRYKLRLRDLYDTRLPSALALSRRPEGGWTDNGEDALAPLLSIVIPAYNEEHRLPLYLPAVLNFAKSLPGGAEVLVVDDGSSDRTAAYVQDLSDKQPLLRLIRQEKNQGKGAAVQRGVLESSGKYVLFADADGSTPIEEVTKLLPVADSGIEVVIASRKGGGEVDRSLLRGLMGATFYRLTNLLAVPGVSDTQCGFKLFRRSSARRLFPLVAEKGWAFDVEVLFLAQKLAFAIVEVPVDWKAVEGSKVNPIKDAIKMSIALLRIRRRCAGLVETFRDGS